MKKDVLKWMFIIFIINLLVNEISAAVVPPPWSDPDKNPCAALPGGWQLLYWPPLRRCFKIFQMGYPCPDTMELSPVGFGITNTGSTAECRCPPGTAQSPLTSRCHKLFEREPCDLGQYFAPIPDSPVKSAIPKQRWGICRKPEKCDNGMAFYPKDAKCYNLYTRGPCSKGKLLVVDTDKIAKCMCENEGKLSYYYHSDTETCYEHFTKGPCHGTGELFLPDGNCGCNQKLPHYHTNTHQCYEIGKIGPCPNGHIFIIPEASGSNAKATCQCKHGYVLWEDGYCYRLYTRGPCDDDHFIVNSTTCLKNPCEKGRLYLPQEKTCYRIGTQGPCSLYQVVIFDFTTRPSIDGISYNGVCGCSGILSNLDQSCSESDVQKSPCESTPGMVEIERECYKLYTRGPCGPGQWLEPIKIPNQKSAKCQCRPGYTPYESSDVTSALSGCQAPSVGIARYLNGKTNKTLKLDFQQFVSLLETTN